LSRDPMASRDAYQKLCGLIADPGSSLINKYKRIFELGQKIKKLQAPSSKLDSGSGR